MLRPRCDQKSFKGFRQSLRNYSATVGQVIKIFSADPNEIDSDGGPKIKPPSSMFRRVCTFHFAPRQILAEIDPKKFLLWGNLILRGTLETSGIDQQC